VAPRGGSSVVEDRQVEFAEPSGVGHHVDLNDLPTRDREAERTRATSVVSQPPRFSTPLVSARLSRSQLS
jgi:hypothetical protein